MGTLDVRGRPEVSIVVPAYNAAGTIDRALGSIDPSGVDGYEVIVVDDGSSDDTAERAACFPCTHVICTANHGAAHARNIGILRASGEYIAFLDADDEWLPGKLEKQLQVFREHPTIGLVCSDFIKCGGGRDASRGYAQHAAFRAWVSQAHGDVMIIRDAFSALCAASFAATPTVMLRRQDLIRVGAFSERFANAEDYELLLRLAKHTEFAAVDVPLVRVHDVSGSLGSVPARMLSDTESMLSGFERTWGRLPRPQRKALRRKLAHVQRHLAYRARVAGASACGARMYLRSLGNQPKPGVLLDLGKAAVEMIGLRRVNRRGESTHPKST